MLFDMGVRSDWKSLPPRIVSLVERTTVIRPGDMNIAEILDTDRGDLGVKRKDIEAIIWSHNHFDHIGDPSTFPETTELVVGPGVREISWPGYPTHVDAAVLDSDIAGRHVREINFESGLTIGRFRAADYFGDGSFYLLDAPGHAVGHLCGLARVTSSPSSFVFMGADACHHAGVLRPSEYLPLPKIIDPPPFRGPSIARCPGDLLQSLHPRNTLTEPFFTPSRQLFPDHDAALDTVRKIIELDASDDIFVVIAHDLSLRDQIQFHPKTINNWKEEGLRSATRWLFCRDFEKAILKCVN